MQDVAAQHLVFAGQGVDDHFRTGRAVGVVVERPAARLAAVVVDLRCAVKTGGRQRNLAEIGLLDQLIEADVLVAQAHLAILELDIFLEDLPLARGELHQPLLDGLRGILRRLAVEVGAAACCRRRSVRHFVGIGRGDLDAVDIDLEHLGHHLGDLGVQALTHLGAAMVQVDAAIGVDVHQCTTLVEETGGEADAEFHRRQRQALLQDRACGIERADFFASRCIVAAGFQLGGHLLEHVVLDGLVVVGDVALGLAVVVALAHLERVLAQLAGHGVHDLLDGDHALWATEAAVGGIRGEVGLAAMAVDGGVAQVVGVVGVEHGAVDDRAGEVRRIAAVAGQVDLDTVQQAVVIEADVVFDVERVTLAGHGHVFHARQTHLGRAAGEVRDHCAHAHRAGCLGFLAAKATTHAAHVDDDLVHRDAKHFGDQLLHFGGVLRGGVDDYAAVFGGHDRGNLGLQVEVLLPADVQRTLQPTRRAGQGVGRVTTLVGVAVEHEVLLVQRLDHVEHRLQVLVFDDRSHGGLARGFQAVGSHGDHRLADELDLAVGQQRVAGQYCADIQLPRYILSGDGDGHARHLIARRRVDADDAGVGAVAHAGIDVQLIGKLQAVVDVHRLARDVLGRAVVLDAATDAGDQILGEQRRDFFLSAGGYVVRHKRSPSSRSSVRVVRGSICAAGSVRPAGDTRGWRGSRSAA